MICWCVMFGKYEIFWKCVRNFWCYKGNLLLWKIACHKKDISFFISLSDLLYQIMGSGLAGKVVLSPSKAQCDNSKSQ